MTIKHNNSPNIVQVREEQVAAGLLGSIATSTTVDGVQINRVTYYPIRSLLESALLQGAKIEHL